MESLYGGQFSLSTQLIKPNYLTKQHTCYFNTVLIHLPSDENLISSDNTMPKKFGKASRNSNNNNNNNNFITKRLAYNASKKENIIKTENW